MKRRGRYNAMEPVPQPTWLVIRDEVQRPLKIELLEPGVDPRMVMIKAMARSIGLGYEVEELPGVIPLYFCRKGEERRRVSIERANPTDLHLGHGSGSYAVPDPAPDKPANVTPIRRG